MVKNFDNFFIVIIFDKNIIVMKNVIGIPARGESFFQRDREVKKIIGKLRDGNNLNIAAPRRIGKTSILLHLLDKKEGGYVYVYVDTEDINKKDDFFKRIIREVLKTEEIRKSTRLKKMVESGHKFLSRVKGIKIMGQGIDFAEDAEIIDPKEDLINLLSGIELENDREIVILIDEFPQTIQNIIDSNPDNESVVRQFLQANREIRLNPDISKKIRFILTGSIGLNHTVARIGSTAFINDLNSIEIDALTINEAKVFLANLLAAEKITIYNEVAAYLLQRLEWLIPFHIQLSVQEIFSKSEPGSQINKKLVDEAFDSIVQKQNENHFDHYYSRLKKQFKENDFLFANELLDQAANEGSIAKSAIINLSVKHGLEQKWKNIINILLYDGYINNSSNMDIFKFNSPIVRTWWRRFICN